MWSRSPVCARPVRTLARSALSASIDFFILSSAVFLICPTSMAMAASSPRLKVHQRTFVLAEHDAPERTALVEAEHDDRQFLVPAQRERGRVHDAQVLRDRLVEGDPLVALRVGMGLRVGVVHAV